MSAPMPKRRGGTILLVPVVALAVLLLVALGAISPRPALVEVIPVPVPTRTFEAVSEPTLSPVSSPSPMFPVREGEPFMLPEWLRDAVRILAAAGVLGLIGVFLIRLARALVRTERRRAGRPSGNEAVLPEIDDDELAETVVATVVSLRQGIPVDGAVIECWRRLERVAADSGITRRPTQTSQEFTLEVLGSAVVDAAALEDLAGLYRQALFSTHQLTDAHRDRAIAALEALSAQFTHRGPA